MVEVEGRNVLHYVKGRGIIVREGDVPDEYILGEYVPISYA